MGKKVNEALFLKLKKLAAPRRWGSRRLNKAFAKRSKARHPHSGRPGLGDLSHDSWNHVLTHLTFEDQFTCAILSKRLYHGAVKHDTVVSEYGKYMKEWNYVSKETLKTDPRLVELPAWPHRRLRGPEFLSLIDVTLPRDQMRGFGAQIFTPHDTWKGAHVEIKLWIHEWCHTITFFNGYNLCSANFVLDYSSVSTSAPGSDEKESFAMIDVALKAMLRCNLTPEDLQKRKEIATTALRADRLTRLRQMLNKEY